MGCNFSLLFLNTLVLWVHKCLKVLMVLQWAMATTLLLAWARARIYHHSSWPMEPAVPKLQYLHQMY